MFGGRSVPESSSGDPGLGLTFPFVFRFSACRCRVSGSRFRFSDPASLQAVRVYVSGSLPPPLPLLGFRIQILRVKHAFQGSVFGVWGVLSRVSGFGFDISTVKC